jgi:cell division protein FtsW (lipid II flippase)
MALFIFLFALVGFILALVAFFLPDDRIHKAATVCLAVALLLATIPAGLR